MSIDKCSECWEPVDTDIDDEFYTGPDGEKTEGVCRPCRENAD